MNPDLSNLASPISDETFMMLVDEMSPKLIGLARMYVRSHAEDIVQDVWEKFWKNRKLLEVKSNMSAFLFSVTKNACIDYLRKEKRLAYHISTEEYLDVIQTVMIDWEDPESSYMREESKKIIWMMVESLDEIYSAPIKMYYFDGMSVTETAKSLLLPLSTAKWRLYMGRQLLKKIMMKEGFING